MENVIKALYEHLKTMSQLMKKQTDVLFEALAPLKKLPELIQAQTKNLQEGLSDGIRAQILVAIAQQKGNIGSREVQIREELEQIDRLQARSRGESEKLQAKYRRQVDRIDGETSSAIDQLDAPVLNLTRNMFMDAIHNPMVEKVIPTWQLTSAAGFGSRECRRIAFEASLGEVREGVGMYRELIRETREKGAALRHDLPDTEEIKVPVLAVQIEVNGLKKTRLIPAPEIMEDGRLSSSLPWLQDLVGGTASRLWDRMKEEELPEFNLTGEEILKMFEKYPSLLSGEFVSGDEAATPVAPPPQATREDPEEEKKTEFA